MKTQWSDTVKWGAIPEHMRGGVTRYVEQGIPPGHFLLAVFNNDLMEACARGDDQNVRLLGGYAKLLVNQCPGACWGNEENVKQWLLRGGIEGNRKNPPLPRHEWSRFADQQGTTR